MTKDTLNELEATFSKNNIIIFNENEWLYSFNVSNITQHLFTPTTTTISNNVVSKYTQSTITFNNIVYFSSISFGVDKSMYLNKLIS